MFQEYFIQQGQIITYTADANPNGLFNLNKWFKRMAARYNIAIQDICCAQDPLNQPVRFNTTSSHLEYFNTATQAWTTVPHL